MKISQIASELAQAESVADLGRRAVTAIGQSMPCSAINFVPLWPNPADTEGGAVYYDDRLAMDLFPTVLIGLASHMEEVANLNQLFAAPKSCLNAHSIIGWQQYRRTRTYQEHWHEYGTEQQFIMGLGSLGCLKGFIAACRAEGDRPFSRREKQQLLEARDALASAMAAFRITRNWAEDDSDLLKVLSEGVPIPTIIWNSRGHLVWINHEAELRLDMLAFRYGSNRYYTAGKQMLADLWHCASNELDAPGWSLCVGQKLVKQWMTPTEELVVRRFPRRDQSPHVLLCFAPMANPADPAKETSTPASPKLRDNSLAALSPREMEVAVLAANSYTVLNIAARLGVAESTIQTHMKRIHRKLAVTCRADLVRRVLTPSRRS